MLVGICQCTAFQTGTYRQELEKFCLEEFINNELKGQGNKIATRAKGEKVVSVLKEGSCY